MSDIARDPVAGSEPHATLHVGGRPVGRDSASPGPGGPRTATTVAAGGVAHQRPLRSVPARDGGFDRVGGSRLTGAGAVLLIVVTVVFASPPRAADQELVTVVWASLLGVLVIGAVSPLVLVRGVRVDATSRRDATVGEVVPVMVTVSGWGAGIEVRALDPTGPWHRAVVGGHGTVDHLADRRGLFQVVRIEVRATAPLGVLAAHRVHEIVLPHAVEVAPRPLPVSWLPAAAPVEGSAFAQALPALSGDLVRSVRPYVSGDPPHLVHWPSSARLGELVVRELELPAPVGQAVVCDLRDLGADTERAASYALGACRAVLASGGQLVVATAEAAGPVAGPVRTPLDAGRRLARAVPGVPGAPPEGWPVVEIGS